MHQFTLFKILVWAGRAGAGTQLFPLGPQVRAAVPQTPKAH